MQLTPNFNLEEFAVSSDFPKLAEKIEFLDRDIEKIRGICLHVLEPVRKHFGKKIIITSGKRSSVLNKRVGGHPRSAHLFNYDRGACDFVVEKIPPSEVALWIKEHCQVRKIIFYPDRGFTHISFPDLSLAFGQLFSYSARVNDYIPF